MAATWPIKFTNGAKPGNALKHKESVIKDYEERKWGKFESGSKIRKRMKVGFMKLQDRWRWNTCTISYVK
jgi:hypothetical protein